VPRQKLGVKHEPLSLIPPQFEVPHPQIQPAVFMPSVREPAPPSLELFDLVGLLPLLLLLLPPPPPPLRYSVAFAIASRLLVLVVLTGVMPLAGPRLCERHDPSRAAHQQMWAEPPRSAVRLRRSGADCERCSTRAQARTQTSSTLFARRATSWASLASCLVRAARWSGLIPPPPDEANGAGVRLCS
jgi:hypothetical protein